MQSTVRQQPGDAAADVPRHAAGQGAEDAGRSIYGRLVGGSNAHFTGNFWRLRPSDFNEASSARRRARHRPGRLADHLRGTRAVLHEGRMGARRLRRAGPVRSAALAAVSDAAAAGEVVGRAAGARRAGARPASAAVADGDQLAALQRPARLPALRLLPVLHVRVPREVDVDGRRCCRWRRRRAAARSGRTATWRGSRSDRTAARRASSYFDAQKQLQLQRAKAVVLCANGAETPRLLLNSRVVALSARPGQLERRGRQAPDVQHLLRGERAVRASAQRVQERAEHAAWCSTSTTPIRSAASTAAAASTRGSASIRSRSRSAACRRTRRRGARASRASLAEQFTRTMFFGTHGTSLPLETNSITIDPSLKDAWGLPCMRVTYKDHPDDLKMRAVPRRARAMRDRAGGRRAARRGREPIGPQTQSVHLLGTCRMGNDPRTSVVDRYHRTHDVPQSLHLRRQQHGHVVARPADRRPSRRWRSARASTSPGSRGAARSERRTVQFPTPNSQLPTVNSRAPVRRNCLGSWNLEVGS